MDRGAWRATVCGFSRTRHNLMTEHVCARKLKITFVAHLVFIVYIYVEQNCSRGGGGGVV